MEKNYKVNFKDMNKCPNCGSSDCDFDEEMVDSPTSMHRSLTCNECLCKFTHYFEFTGVEIDE